MSFLRISPLAALMAAIGVLACGEPVGVPDHESSALRPVMASGSGSGGDQDNSGPGSGDEDRVELQATVEGTDAMPAADGHARFRAEDGDHDFRIEMEDLPAGTVIDVHVAGEFIGSAAADAFGVAELAIDTDDGDRVPMMSPGDEIKVFSALVLIAEGAFGS